MPLFLPPFVGCTEAEDEPAVRDPETGRTVAAAADRHLEAVVSSETDGCSHVGGIDRAQDQRRAPVNPGDKKGLAVS